MKCRNPGIDVEFLIAALKLAGLEAEVIPFDYTIHQAIEMIQNGSADITVHAIIQSVERFKLVKNKKKEIVISQKFSSCEYVDFTVPINYIVYGYIIAEDEDFQVKDFILHSLQPAVLFLLLTTLFIRRYTLANAFFLISWIWFCFFFTQYFESALTSALTLSAKKGYDFVNLDGLLEAVEKKGWRIRLEEDGYDPMTFCRQTHDQCARLERALKQRFSLAFLNFKTERIGSFLATPNWQIGLKMPPKTVTFAGMNEKFVPTDVVAMDRVNKVLFIKDLSLQPSHLAFALNKNLSRNVLERLNRGLETIQGSYANFAARYTHPYAPYARPVHSSSEFNNRGLIYLWPLFRLCFIFIGCSIGVLLVEIILGCRLRASYNLTN